MLKMKVISLESVSLKQQTENEIKLESINNLKKKYTL